MNDSELETVPDGGHDMPKTVVMSKEYTPFLPSVDLINWVTDKYTEPCSQCGGGHEDRTKYVCSSCNRLFCARRIREVDGGLHHIIVWREQDALTRTFCGPVDACGDWDQIAPRLTQIVDDLE